MRVTLLKGKGVIFFSREKLKTGEFRMNLEKVKKRGSLPGL
jgi:hypothetical protein